MAWLKDPIKNRLYPIWDSMIDRCHDPKHRDFHRYGARGIFVCDEWRYSYQAFEVWALAKGFRFDQPNAQKTGLSIEREENDGPYSPDNCTWANRSQQAYNRRTKHLVTAFGETKHITDWPKDVRCIVNRFTLLQRLSHGVPPEQAMTFPKQNGGGALRPGGNKLVDIIRRHNQSQTAD